MQLAISTITIDNTLFVNVPVTLRKWDPFSACSTSRSERTRISYRTEMYTSRQTPGAVRRCSAVGYQGTPDDVHFLLVESGRWTLPLVTKATPIEPSLHHRYLEQIAP